MPSVPRYVWPALAACLIVAIGLSVAWYLKRSAVHTIREEMKTAAEAGQLPDELKDRDWDRDPLTDVGTEVTAQVMMKVQIADLLWGLWFVWVPIVFAACFTA